MLTAGPGLAGAGRLLCGLLRARERGAGRAGVLAGPSRVGPRGKEREEWAGAGLTWAGFWVLAGFWILPFLFLSHF